SMIQAVDSGKVDLALGAISITEERKQSVDFCDTTYSGAVTLLVCRDKVAPELLNEDKQSLEEKLNKSKVGVMQGTVAVDYLKENYSGAEILEYDSISDAVQALKSKKVDYVMTVYSTAKNYEKSNDELYVLDDISVPEDIAIAVKKGNTELRDKLDALVGKYKSDGTMDKILANWFGENGKEPAYDTSSIPENDSSAPVLKVGVVANREPMCFVLGEGYGGVDIELIKRIAYELGMRTEFSDMNFSSLIPALENGKVDVVVSNIVYTEERAKIVDFTQPYFDNPQVLLTRKTDEEILAEKSGWEQFWSNFKDSFTRTFITENRWKLVLNGLAVTIIISICAFIVGSIWGGVICALLRSKRKIANIPAKVYVRLLQGTPIVVLLMILYYIVFKDFDINAIVVAIIGFALNLGAYTSQIFKTAIESVDKGQIEAAFAMGFNKFQVFIKIIFPQAARNALPVYKGEFISLVKSTSIVGYIAIQDLTKVSDIIRSRTYEAFFPLIATAIIYFLVTYIFIVLLNVLEKKIDPKRRKRVVKGVDEK
ncbi:MAG: ABC transporter permease subunit, partial [[Eubacterium] saphenum]|nr:ABC transporter permease subunit [[Eubacterium] saphenum]